MFCINCKANKLKKSGGVGYTEKDIFSWDGNTEGKVSGADVFFKVSDKTPDANTVVRVKGIIAGVELESGADNCVVQEFGFGSMIALQLDDGAGPVAAVCTEAKDGFPETGLYLIANDVGICTYIEFAETIHPIDPKFLPIVEVNLTDYGIDIVSLVNTFGGSQTVEVGNFWEDVLTEGFLRLKIPYADGHSFFVDNPIVLRSDNHMGQIAFTVLLNAGYGTLLYIRASIANNSDDVSTALVKVMVTEA